MKRAQTVNPDKTAVLVVDVQKLETRQEIASQNRYYYDQIHDRVLPNIERILSTSRANGVEVLYTVIESLTDDGRDRSLDHKLSGIFVPKSSPLGQVADRVAPVGDEIVLNKTSSGVFNSTSIDYVLRNLGIETLIVVGLRTDQCVDMAVRDGADKGYYVICVEDACAATTGMAHDAALRAIGGYCELTTTEQILPRLERRT